ncbi:uncharacterized protein MONOS_3032 [Monocercomonoides exilis]|uniref:uncharacterized protein n=1 Tax=Monocercomonoides exilis TaxID=2049356 RepID=UPI00355A8FB2|nr:hypothetical protein MONOS_3032 [Monocercomonoides exilis]|eukprot:MONOS_3032.1-p1 / transcript=MONOS_3032.1 / gene=MONOS_3032 / organism=Monocercomonoides_exilis_PA203 / gene_product=unspecified product / transcript_product=unspecified product / location=Mono_scaffold00067:74014-75217(-) / protein_length=379 / sequence_SO=supercontig / SO=protein_coding / is_pseudo=false
MDFLILFYLSLFCFCINSEDCAREGSKCRDKCSISKFQNISLGECIIRCQNSLDECLKQTSATNLGLNSSPFSQTPPPLMNNESDITRTEGYGFHEGYDVLGNTVNGKSEMKDLLNEPLQKSSEDISFIPVPGMSPFGDKPLHFAPDGLPEPPDPNSGAFDGPIGRTPDSGFFHQKQERKIFDHDLDIKVRDRQKWEHQLQEVGLLWGDAMNQATKDLAASQPISFRHNPSGSGKTVPPTQNGVYFGFPATQSISQNQHRPAANSVTPPAPTRTYRYTPAEVGPTELFKPIPSSPTRFSSLYNPDSGDQSSSSSNSPSRGIVREPAPEDVASAVQRSQSNLTKAAKQLPSSIADISANRFAEPDAGDLVRVGKGFVME